jgi:hypothetical protein
MATAEKLSVSIHKQELAWARTYAKTSGRSLSSVLTEALREQRRAQAMARLLRRLGAGKLTRAELDAADAELFGR